MTARFCDRHHSWLCGYGEGRCQKGDLWAGSGARSDEQPEDARGEGSEAQRGGEGREG